MVTACSSLLQKTCYIVRDRFIVQIGLTIKFLNKFAIVEGYKKDSFLFMPSKRITRSADFISLKFFLVDDLQFRSRILCFGCD